MIGQNIPEHCWRLSELLRRRAPLVHNITNLVVQNDSADAIAAVGGTQVTLHTVEEARDAAAVCAALVINPGTLDKTWLQCAGTAVAVAAEQAKPWLLDPVAVGLTRYRTAAIADLLERRPTVLKANPTEILVLAGAAAQGRGADSQHSVEQAADAARVLARRYGCTVVVTGARELITDGAREAVVGNGRKLLGQMVGSGCMLGAVIGCYLAVTEDSFAASLAAVAHFTVAGELAADRAAGPGSLKPLLIDALYNLDRDALTQRLRARVSD